MYRGQGKERVGDLRLHSPPLLLRPLQVTSVRLRAEGQCKVGYDPRGDAAVWWAVPRCGSCTRTPLSARAAHSRVIYSAGRRLCWACKVRRSYRWKTRGRKPACQAQTMARRSLSFVPPTVGGTVGGSGSRIAGPQAKAGRGGPLETARPGLPGHTQEPTSQRQWRPRTHASPSLLILQDACAKAPTPTLSAAPRPLSSQHQSLSILPSPLVATPFPGPPLPGRFRSWLSPTSWAAATSSPIMTEASLSLTVLRVLPDGSFHSGARLTSCTFPEVFLRAFPRASPSTGCKQGHVPLHNPAALGACPSAYTGPQSLPGQFWEPPRAVPRRLDQPACVCSFCDPASSYTEKCLEIL